MSSGPIHSIPAPAPFSAATSTSSSGRASPAMRQPSDGMAPRERGRSLAVRPPIGAHRSLPVPVSDVGGEGAAYQNSREARRAPSTRLAIFAHTTPGSTAAWPTQVPKPQSVPAMTRSRPTSLA